MNTFLGTIDADRLRSVVNDAPGALIAVDEHGIIRQENAKAPGMFGYETLLGLPLEVLVPPSKRTNHTVLREGFMRNPAARPMGLGLDLTAVRQDGHEFAIDVALVPQRDTTGMIWAWVHSLNERRERLDVTRMEHALTVAVENSVKSIPKPPDNRDLAYKLLRLQIALILLVICGIGLLAYLVAQ